jgi:ubiquinone/menaquinone biosynthesis C-methylase UbiE
MSIFESQRLNCSAVPDESLRSSEVYWNDAAEKYDEAFTGTFVGKMWRDAVLQELDARFQPGSRVLELNCGTGVDAIHLAQRGVSVLACDISSRMICLARKHTMARGLHERLDFRVLATEQLAALEAGVMFDGAFSNFSGLNCVRDLAQVARNLASVLTQGSPLFLCMLGRFAPWEKLWYLAHADWKTAFRTLRSKGGASTANTVEVHYYSRRKIVESFSPGFKLRKWKGIGIAVPPSYMEHWALRFPAITTSLNRVDRLIGNAPVLRNFGGCILFEFERSAEPEKLEGDYAARS